MNRNKRKRNIILTEPAHILYKQVRKQKPHWDFSRWVSMKLMEEFELDERDLLKKRLGALNMEKERVIKEYDAKIRALVEMLKDEG